MATKDSQELKSDERYPLGDYSFRIERSSVPGSTNDKIEAICTDKDGHNARKSIQIPSNAQLLGWYVEANDTTADVYVHLKSQPVYTGNIQIPIPSASSGILRVRMKSSAELWDTQQFTAPNLTMVVKVTSGRYWDTTIIAASTEPGGVLEEITDIGTIYNYYLTKTFTANGKTVYYTNAGYAGGIKHEASPQAIGDSPYIPGVAWNMVYEANEDEEVLIARFAIDLEDAGGVGPGGGTGGGWNDPEDYDEDWEEGDPMHTLYVEVTGALSGRHNDPIEDPSYSYIPADKNTIKDYGCGGDGGHGGGGGAGAATVVIHKFATNQANSKEVTAIAKRHGYGSGGGKGGKGGDGCILVYY